MEIKLGVSNRHVHLCKEDLECLFGNTHELEIKNMLVQTGEFASTSVVTIKTDKSQIENVRVLGPLRNYSQVEVSLTDCYKLGINPPVRNSGELDGAALIEIVGPSGSVKKECAIIAARHIHFNTNNAHGYNNNDIVKVSVCGSKKGILDDVYVKIADTYAEEIHFDTDDANAFGLKTGDILEIIE